MGIKQLYIDHLRKLPNEYGDVSVMTGSDVIIISTKSNPVMFGTVRFVSKSRLQNYIGKWDSLYSFSSYRPFSKPEVTIYHLSLP